jgi:hypothetical protein
MGRLSMPLVRIRGLAKKRVLGAVRPLCTSMTRTNTYSRSGRMNGRFARWNFACDGDHWTSESLSSYPSALGSAEARPAP